MERAEEEKGWNEEEGPPQPQCSPESGPGPVGVVGQGPPEDHGRQGGPGDEQVCALRDHADRCPGTHLHSHAVVAVHRTASHLHLERGRQGDVSEAGRVPTRDRGAGVWEQEAHWGQGLGYRSRSIFLSVSVLT